MLLFRCEKCNHLYYIPEKYAQKSIKCGQCLHTQTFDKNNTVVTNDRNIVHVSCPKCRHVATVPLSEKNVTILCEKCKKMFVLKDSRGASVMPISTSKIYISDTQKVISVVLVGFIILGAFILWFLFLRDTWDIKNYERIISLKSMALENEKRNPEEARKLYQELFSLIEGHQINNQHLKETIEQAKLEHQQFQIQQWENKNFKRVLVLKDLAKKNEIRNPNEANSQYQEFYGLIGEYQSILVSNERHIVTSQQLKELIEQVNQSYQLFQIHEEERLKAIRQEHKVLKPAIVDFINELVAFTIQLNNGVSYIEYAASLRKLNRELSRIQDVKSTHFEHITIDAKMIVFNFETAGYYIEKQLDINTSTDGRIDAEESKENSIHFALQGSTQFIKTCHELNLYP